MGKQDNCRRLFKSHPFFQLNHPLRADLNYYITIVFGNIINVLNEAMLLNLSQLEYNHSATNIWRTHLFRVMYFWTTDTRNTFPAIAYLTLTHQVLSQWPPRLAYSLCFCSCECRFVNITIDAFLQLATSLLECSQYYQYLTCCRLCWEQDVLLKVLHELNQPVLYFVPGRTIWAAFVLSVAFQQRSSTPCPPTEQLH
jgi:hypothetical protein